MIQPTQSAPSGAPVWDGADAVAVRFYFSDADPVAECECGWRSVGDAAVDAFRAWWKHRASHDTPVVGPPRGKAPESPAGRVWDRAVTAAAEAIEDAAVRLIGRDLGTLHRDEIVAQGLAAGLPLLLDDLAERIERTVEPDPIGDWSLGMLGAARLVRGFASEVRGE